MKKGRRVTVKEKRKRKQMKETKKRRKKESLQCNPYTIKHLFNLPTAIPNLTFLHRVSNLHPLLYNEKEKLKTEISCFINYLKILTQRTSLLLLARI